MLPATTTNAITNFLHATFLFIYFVGMFIHYRKGDKNISVFFVYFFFTLFVVKLLGVYVHYFIAPTAIELPPTWIAISLLMILLNYFLIEAIDLPDLAKIIIMFLSILSSYFFFTEPPNFIYVAFPVLVVYAIAAYYKKHLLRVGFILVIASNIIWIVVRAALKHYLGDSFTPQYKYDNDFYHLLLIISTFIVYKAIVKNSM